jgi:hypothetical protein
VDTQHTSISARIGEKHANLDLRDSRFYVSENQVGTVDSTFPRRSGRAQPFTVTRLGVVSYLYGVSKATQPASIDRGMLHVFVTPLFCTALIKGTG